MGTTVSYLAGKDKTGGKIRKLSAYMYGSIVRMAPQMLIGKNVLFVKSYTVDGLIVGRRISVTIVVKV